MKNPSGSGQVRVLALISFALAACGGSEGTSQDSANAAASSAANDDVQAISAKAYGNVDMSLDLLKCRFFDKMPDTIQNSGFTTDAKADCTDVVAALEGVPPINTYTEPLVWVREDPNPSYAVSRHWCAQLEVVVAVKAAAWDAPSFKGIGFYGYDELLNSDESARQVFYDKNDSRLSRVGERSLKNGDKVYLYKFGGAGPCETNGDGDNPSGRVEFKAFVRYDGDQDRWENVSENHTVSYEQTWDRSGDLLQ